MPEYDKWYKDVLKGERRCFYPNRVRLLETSGVPMFLFHVHHHGIVGEAQIVRSTMKDGEHLYWFDEFITYPLLVQLESIKTNSKLPRMVLRGHWTLVYISNESIEEIRSLSNLPEGKRKKLENDLHKVIEQLKIRPFARQPLSWRHRLTEECEKVKRNYKFNEQILAETKKHFDDYVRKKFSRGRRFDTTFYSSLYLAFRMLKSPKLLIDIAEISGISPKKLGRNYRLIVRKLNLTVPPLNPEKLVRSRSGKLHLSRTTTERAISLVQEARKREIILGQVPSSIAAAATVIACKIEGEEKSKKQIADVFGISTVTLRNYSKKLEVLNSEIASRSLPS